MKKILKYIAIIVLLALTISVWMSYVYSQRYVQDSPTTATTGIIWETTLNLVEYRNISSGNNMLGNFDRYTRSDRMGAEDAITVYCNDFCKKDIRTPR